ncbi:MAG: dipeptidase [Flavobacteriaceae bacterium]
MRSFILFICFLSIISCNQRAQDDKAELRKTAARIHQNVITLDTHNDIDVKNFTDTLNYTQRLPTQVNLPKMEEGGLDVSWLIVYTGQDSLNDAGYSKAKANAMAKFEAIHRLCEEIAPEQIEMARTSADVRRILKSGKKVAMIGVENAYPMGLELGEFERYHELGARYISLAHNGHSQFSDSHTGEENNDWLYNGLSELGKQAVIEMNRLGIMIDVSHLSKMATDQILQISKTPVIASHSSARALCPHSRNMDDESLKLLKENGGVVQTVALGSYIDEKKSAQRQTYMTSVYKSVSDSLGVRWHDWSEFSGLSEQEQTDFLDHYPQIISISNELVTNRSDVPPDVDVGDFVDHIDYMVALIGIDHVGISSDFDGGGGISGWSDASETLNITVELVKRGYNEDEISKLWSGNLLRVLDEVQEFASSQNSI